MFEEAFEALKQEEIRTVSGIFVTTADSSMHMHIYTALCIIYKGLDSKQTHTFSLCRTHRR